MSSSSLAGVYPLAERVGNPLDPAASVEPQSPSAVLPEYHVGRYVQYRSRLELFHVLSPPVGLLDALVMAPCWQLVAPLSPGDMAYICPEVTMQAIQFELAMLHNMRWPGQPGPQGHYSNFDAQAWSNHVRNVCGRALSSTVLPLSADYHDHRARIDKYLLEMNEWSHAMRDFAVNLQEHQAQQQMTMNMSCTNFVSLDGRVRTLERALAAMSDRVHALEQALALNDRVRTLE